MALHFIRVLGCTSWVLRNSFELNEEDFLPEFPLKNGSVSVLKVGLNDRIVPTLEPSSSSFSLSYHYMC